MRNRGNAHHIISEGRSAGSSSFSIDLGFRLADRSEGRFAFDIEVRNNGDFGVSHEVIMKSEGEGEPAETRYLFAPDRKRQLIVSETGPVVGEADPRLRSGFFLRHCVDVPWGGPVVDLMTSMAFYNLNPASMRTLRPREPGLRLVPDGSNVPSLLRRTAEVEDPELLERITTYLAHIQPGLREIRAEDLGGYDLMTLRQDIANEPGWWDARPDQISDGTLRALGVLVALFQGRLGGKSETSLVGIEEPEAGLHPAAANVLADALADASYTTQVVATTHSADMLHMGDVDLDDLLVVSAENGVTSIGPVDDVSRSVVPDRLFTIGELMQADQIRPRGVGPAVYGERVVPDRSVTVS